MDIYVFIRKKNQFEFEKLQATCFCNAITLLTTFLHLLYVKETRLHIGMKEIEQGNTY